MIIDADDIKRIHPLLLEESLPHMHSYGYRTRRVFPMADLRKELRLGKALLRIILYSTNLIAGAPHNNTGVITEAPDHPGEVFLRPLIKVLVISVLALGTFPFVEGLHHHHEAHLVAELHQFRRRLIMGSADGVAAHILEDFQLML